MEANSYLLNLIATIGHIMTGIGTVVLVILIVKTLVHMKAATRFTEIQTNYKFRPWVGPSGSIREIDETESELRFEITLKNFGDLPASNVTIKSVVSNNNISREQIKSKEVNSFKIGPLLPNMEKRYWLYVNKDIFKRSLDSKKPINTAVYFEYDHLGQDNGYGMISELSTQTKSFVHKDMWVDTTVLK
jgi:hypothetical protein